VCGLLASLIDELAESLREITGRHHAVLLEEVADRGCYDVTHLEMGKEIRKRGDSK
jgi:hypothetical protein